ncbi:MAG: hypothetical protein EOO04_32615 [Chitinophagaceae bacterium]|nr:MAG: hypothetical protein EOO04_32615 [Chitinophagaceae bacterium]
MELSANQRLEARLDLNDYDESELVEMRVSLNLPYQNDQAEFERVSGEVEINGKHYNYVKRRIEKGQLVVMCIPNQDKSKIENTRDDYFKLINDLQQNGDSKKSEKSSSTAFKALFGEYNAETNNWSITSPVHTTGLTGNTDSRLISSLFVHTPGQPPECC